MLASTNLLFYSANTYLSYIINKQFYGGQHYLWCAPVFNPGALDSLNPLRNIPTSSSPLEIYNLYHKGVSSNDGHSPLIKQNKSGIKRGAKFKLLAKIITEHEYQMIIQRVNKASISDFRPLIYLIPAPLVSAKIKVVPVKAAANPLGLEYRVEDLMEGEFEIIDSIRC